MKQWWDHSWKWPECSLGILLILLGLIALFLPGMILGVLSLALGIPILVFGAVQIVRSVRLYKMMGALPMPMLLTGVIAAVVGLAFLVYPSMPASVFGTIFGIWALGSGTVKMNRAISSRQAGDRCAWLFVQSFIHIAFGFFLVVNPVGITSLWVSMIGAYLVYLGITFFIQSLHKKG